MIVMAKEIKKAQVEEVEDVEIDVEDLELDGIEEVEVEDDAVEAELEAEEKPKTVAKEKKKRTAPTGSTLASVQPLNENEVGVAYIAEALGIEGREVRAFLRKNYRDMNAEKGQRYRWEKGSAELQSIIDNFKAEKANKAATPKVAKTEK